MSHKSLKEQKYCDICNYKLNENEYNIHIKICCNRKKVLDDIKKINVLSDSMTFENLISCIENYNNTIKFEIDMNKKLLNKKIRKTNFPSHISENIVKFAYCKKYNIMPDWDTKIECKGSINLNNGPPTFGPTESWDYIYFVDGIDTLNKNYKIYEIKLKNNSKKWSGMLVNKKEKYQDHCNQGRRPRLTFESICSQIGEECKLIFSGNITKLNNLK